MKCIFCQDNAVATFYMDMGCICHNEIIQSLCMQHIVRANPLGSMDLIKDFTINHNFTKWWFTKRNEHAP